MFFNYMFYTDVLAVRRDDGNVLAEDSLGEIRLLNTFITEEVATMAQKNVLRTFPSSKSLMIGPITRRASLATTTCAWPLKTAAI